MPAVAVEKHGATPPQSDDVLHVKRLQPDDVPESEPVDVAQVAPAVALADASHVYVVPLMQPD